MPKFQPNRAKPVAAALYNYLSDGSPKSLDEVYRVISAAVPMDKALRYRSRSKGETQDAANLARKQREVVRIAILVAARDGRVVVEDNTITLNSEVAEAWRAFVAQGSDSVEPVTPDVSVEESTERETVSVFA